MVTAHLMTGTPLAIFLSKVESHNRIPEQAAVRPGFYTKIV